MWMFNPGDKLLAVASPVLEARLAPAPEQAIPIWRQAVKAQDELGHDEPPAFYYPVSESAGGALLRAGKPAEAESVFRECLHAADSVRRLFPESWKILMSRSA